MTRRGMTVALGVAVAGLTLTVAGFGAGLVPPNSSAEHPAADCESSTEDVATTAGDPSHRTTTERCGAGDGRDDDMGGDDTGDDDTGGGDTGDDDTRDDEHDGDDDAGATPADGTPTPEGGQSTPADGDGEPAPGEQPQPDDGQQPGGRDQSGEEATGTDQDQDGGETADGDQPGGETTDDDQPGDETTDGDQPGDDATDGDQSGDETTDDDQPGDDATDDDQPGDETTDGDQPGDETTDGDQPGDDATDGDQSGDETTDDDQPGDDATDDDQPGDEATETEPVTGEPELDAFAPNRTVEPGDSRQLAVSVVNSGTVADGGTATDPDAEQAVTTARNVRVTLTEGDAPVTVESGTVPLGDLQSGAVSRAGFGIDVDADADPGTYDLDAEIEYEYTAEIDENESQTVEETSTVPVELVVTETGRFAVDSVDADLQVGEQGTVELDLENQGEADLTEATVQIRSRTRGLLVDGSGGQPGADAPGASRFVGEWDAGDDATVSFAATPTNRSTTQEYALEAVVEYVDPDGDRRRSRPLSFGVTPDEEQAFTLDDLDADLQVGEDGTIEGEITNDGPAPATDAVVSVVAGGDVTVEGGGTAGERDEGPGSSDASVVAQRSSAFLGDLDAGEDEEFELPVSVGEGAEPGELGVRLVVDYLNADGDPRRSRELRDAVEIDAEEPDFELDSIDGDLQVGDDGTVSVTLSNAVGDDLTEARVSLTSRSDDLLVDGGTNASRFVGEWAEGANETVDFDVTATNGSTAAAYPVTVRVAYTDADGDEARAEPIRTSISPDDEQAFGFANLSATLRVGEQGRVTGRVRNEGPRNVSNAALVVEPDDDELTAERSSVPLGDLSVNETASFDYPFEVGDDAEPGPRQFRVAVEYETDDGDRLRSDRQTVAVALSARRDGFAVTNATVPVQVGESGTITLTVENRRNRTVSDARVDLRSGAGVLAVDGADNGTRFVGRWRPGERRTVRYELSAANGSAAQNYAVRALVSYEGEDGEARESDPIRFGIEPRPEQAFAVENVTSRLRVAEEGTVEARVVNEGPGNATAALVRLETDTETTEPQETEYALGSLRSGAAGEFSFPVEITSDAEPTPRLFTFRVEYADAEGDRTTSDRLTARVPVRPERDRFVVRGVETTVVRGEDEAVTLDVRNARNETLRNVNAKVFVDDPLESDDEAFVPRIDPNESVRLTFDVSAGGDASTGTVPLRIDFEYDRPDGDSELSDTYQVGVNVTEPADGGLLDRVWPLGLVTVLSLSGMLVGRRYWSE